MEEAIVGGVIGAVIAAALVAGIKVARELRGQLAGWWWVVIRDPTAKLTADSAATAVAITDRQIWSVELVHASHKRNGRQFSERMWRVAEVRSRAETHLTADGAALVGLRLPIHWGSIGQTAETVERESFTSGK